jgi:hypothetical protein
MAGSAPEVVPIESQSNSQGPPKLKGLVDALSRIQMIYGQEKNGNQIDPNFLPLMDSLDYFLVGLKASIHEGVWFIGLMVLMLPFFADPILLGSLTSAFPLFGNEVMLWLIQLLPVIFIGGFCCYLSRFYMGSYTRKAIDSLLVGRLVALLLKGIFMFWLLVYLSECINPERAWKIGKTVCFWNYDWQVRVYQIVMEIKPLLLERAAEVLIVFWAGFILPFVIVWGHYWYRRAKITMNLRKWRYG